MADAHFGGQEGQGQGGGEQHGGVLQCGGRQHSGGGGTHGAHVGQHKALQHSVFGHGFSASHSIQ